MTKSTSRRSAYLAAALMAAWATSTPVAAQGNPEAQYGVNRSQPTSSWTQWQPKPTYPISRLPDQYMGADRAGPTSPDQTGFNQCASGKWNQASKCQTSWINSARDFCLFGPDRPGAVGDIEREAVVYCTTPDHGTRLIPDGTLTSVHFVVTPSYVQVTGTGDFTSIGIPQGDAGGELDPHGADDLGNPIGGVLYTTQNPSTAGQPWQASEWTQFISWNQYCLRACWGDDDNLRCQHIYDVLGCAWNLPANYDPDVFESCEGDVGLIQGIYDGSTFFQGQPSTPAAHPAPPSSQCTSSSTVSHGLLQARVASPTAAANGAVSPGATSAPSATSRPTSAGSGSSSSNLAGAARASARLDAASGLAGLAAGGLALAAAWLL